MIRLQTIENALKNINGDVFAELCASYLKIKNTNYRAFSRKGSQVGKQKSVVGTPDSFFLLANGTYLYVEYTTNESDRQKLNADIASCFDEGKTKISKEKIEEIVLCFNWNIDQEKINELELLANGYNPDTKITYLMLYELASELDLRHRNLVHDYLGLSLATGQIVSTETFVAEYNKASQQIATPLDNAFLHREQELEELKKAIAETDFIILTGAAGVGKTKLSLEGINGFLSENLSFDAYCISYKHHTLLDDLRQYLDAEKDYILFVDNANRIEHFEQITGFYKDKRKGKLKILITVRAYAFNEVEMLCQEFETTPIHLTALSDAQIVDIVRAKPFETNPCFHKDIARIANGNPRLAIMAARLANAKNHIYALHDVSDLFEKYFSTFIRDNGAFKNPSNIKCLGLIAFFHTIPYKKNKELTTSILANFGIDYTAFADGIEKLNDLELVEVQFGCVKISEQNLSTHFFYKAFIKDDLLSFETLLNNYFNSHYEHFNNSVISASNMNGFENVITVLKPFLQTYWNKIKSEEKQVFKFLSVFWYCLQDETLEFIYNFIDKLPPCIGTPEYGVAYSNTSSYKKDDTIKLLGDFLRFPDNLKDAIELGFGYTRKQPDKLAEWIHKIKEQLHFYIGDETRHRFEKQTILFDILIAGLNKKNALLTTAFYELSKTFLNFEFHCRNTGFKHSIELGNDVSHAPTTMQELRGKIWSAIENNYTKNPDDLFKVLSNAKANKNFTRAIMAFDLPFLVGIIEHLTPSSFEHCKYVQDQIRRYKEHDVSNDSFDSLAQKFTNPDYEMFALMDWDMERIIERPINSDEYLKLSETEIRSAFIFSDISEVKTFYTRFKYLKQFLTESTSNHNYNLSLDYIIDENYLQNFELGCQLLNEVIEDKNSINYEPQNFGFTNHLKTKKSADAIWKILQSHEFNCKASWEFSFYRCLDSLLMSKEYVRALVHTITSMEGKFITFGLFEFPHFLKIEPNLSQIILRAITDKNEKEGTKLAVWITTFETHFEQLGDDIELIKRAYLQQDLIDSHFDLVGKGFLKILKKDSSFLFEYVTNLYSKKKYLSGFNRKNLSVIWQVENIEQELRKVFDLAIKKESTFRTHDHFYNSFFKPLEDDAKEKAKNFLLSYCQTNFSDINKMNLIIDVVRHSMKEILKEMLLLFLSLSQDKELFSKIFWLPNQRSWTGDDTLSDIDTREWKNILAIIEKSRVGIRLIPIKKYVNDNIARCLDMSNSEKERSFLNGE